MILKKVKHYLINLHILLKVKNMKNYLFDKDHYNTLELLYHPEKEFRNHGHNKIFQYFFLLLVGLISLKIIFFYENKRNNLLYFFLIFSLILLVQIINSYLLYLLDNFIFFNLIYFYIINSIFLTLTYFLIHKILK